MPLIVTGCTRSSTTTMAHVIGTRSSDSFDLLPNAPAAL